MAYVISDDCIACGTCIDECPVGFYFSTKKTQCQEEKYTSLSILVKPAFCVKYLNIQRSQPIHNTFQT